MHWLTTILIFLPVAGALVIAALPLPRYWVGSLASLISLVEVGVWITSATKFDFGSPSLQFAQFHLHGFAKLRVDLGLPPPAA